MKPVEIEKQADDVLAAYEVRLPPVDVLSIAKAEGIELAEGSFGESFCGRIEYHPEVKGFVLFHPRLDGSRHAGRVRFSIAHELAHYFLDHHRTLLMAGKSHNSTSDFICDNELERDADGFAAALLLPSYALRQKLTRRPFMTLREILALAREWQTSATSAAIRYARFATEGCAAVLSQDGVIRFYSASDEAAALGFRFLRSGTPVPPSSQTHEIGRGDSCGDIREASTCTEAWFPDRRACHDLWEEAFPLGGTGLVLTLLSFHTNPV